MGPSSGGPLSGRGDPCHRPYLLRFARSDFRGAGRPESSHSGFLHSFAKQFPGPEDDLLGRHRQYEGTTIGRQELHGELLDISESAIIKKSWLKIWPAKNPDGTKNTLPWLEYVMVSMDTAFTEKTYDRKTFSSDPTACTV